MSLVWRKLDPRASSGGEPMILVDVESLADGETVRETEILDEDGNRAVFIGVVYKESSYNEPL